MYKINIPIMWRENPDEFQREKHLKEMKRAGADRIMLAVERNRGQDGKIILTDNFEQLKNDVDFFKNNGFEVCIWHGESIGHGVELTGSKGGRTKCVKYNNIVSINGVKNNASFCPLDDSFVDDYCERIRQSALTGADMLLLDDDFRMANHGDSGSAGCFCDEHIRMFEQITGEKFTREDIAKLAFSGGANKYRDLWLELQGNTLRRFAEKIRAAADKANPAIRIGLCTAPTTIDLDGITIQELSNILAGNTRPFLRLIGAPYWEGLKGTIGRCIELERMVRHYIGDTDIEIVSEGDTYPRPRFYVPAASLENFDTALRADGGFDGILKYMSDYVSSPDYETAYIDRHVKNKELYAEIEKHFGGKKAVGVRVCEYQRKVNNAEFEDDPSKENIYAAQMTMLPPAVVFAAEHSLPICYEGDGLAFIFGENARYVNKKDLKNGAVLDIKAAKILTEGGTDVGLKNFERTDMPIASEYYINERETVAFSNNEVFYNIEIDDNAELLTKLKSGKEYINGCYRYQNSNGERFMVMPVDLSRAAVTPSYSRQRLIEKEAEWLSGKKPAVVCTGHPYLYILAKEDKNSLTVGLWNFFADEIEGAEVKFGKAYSKAEWIKGNGKLDSDKLTAEKIPPFGFVGFTVKYGM